MTGAQYAEWRAAGVLDSLGLEPRAQYRVRRFVLDFAWPKAKVGLEIDGPIHTMPHMVESDRRRDAELAAAGWYIHRLRYRDLTDHFRGELEPLVPLVARLESQGGDE